MTSTMPSGTPGNSLSSPRAYEMITGSAMRKPRIQPGRGSASDDSMIDGRTIDTGMLPRGLGQRALAERLRVRVGVGPAERRRRGRGPASTMRSLTHCVRRCSVFSASSGAPAAPSSRRASVRKRLQRLGRRDCRLRRRRALGGPRRPRRASRCRGRTGSRTAAPRARRRGGCRRRNRSTPRRGAGRTPSAWSVCAMRVGPSRLTSTALSSGESNATVAAEWMTMSHDGERGASVRRRGRGRRGRRRRGSP